MSTIVISPLHDGGDVSSVARTNNNLGDKPIGTRIGGVAHQVGNAVQHIVGAQKVR